MMDAIFSDIMRSARIRLSQALDSAPPRGRVPAKEAALEATLLEILRSTISVPEGLKQAFDHFCLVTRPERGLIMSSGPLVIPAPTEQQIHILHSWPVRDGDYRSRVGGIRTTTNLCIRAIAEIRHQGEIGLVVYYSCRMPRRATESCRRILNALAQTAAAMIEVDHRYRLLLRALPFDPLTHLPVWALFREKVELRFARLDREQIPATLMLVSFHGLLHTPSETVEAEEAVAQIAHVRDAIKFLQRAIRPTDLIGQIDRESFVLWLDGGDRFVSVERAEQICRRKYMCSAGANPLVSVKIGLVTREPGSHDTLDMFFEKARMALSIAQEEDLDWYFAHESA
ncbi:GGDEF domain-containing protein [Asaia bogorensis]|uniref:GGDEF domain-containing protein n=1 Tax=Asaia bogorensis TaxID=91915 RepID=UPI000EFD5D2B|nr:GGDEF domain-containing protein [Asaia bogorensis]